MHLIFLVFLYLSFFGNGIGYVGNSHWEPILEKCVGLTKQDLFIFNNNM